MKINLKIKIDIFTIIIIGGSQGARIFDKFTMNHFKNF